MCMNARALIEIVGNKLRLGSLRGDIAKIFLYNSLSLCLGMFGSIIIARVLGPTQKGVLNLYSLLTTLIAELGLLGLNSGLLYLLANRKTPLERIHFAAIRGALILGGASLGVVALLVPLLSVGFQGLPTQFVIISGIIAPLLLYRVMWSNLMTGINRATHVYWVGFLLSALSLLCMLILWAMDALTATNFIWVNIALVIMNCLYGFLYLFRIHGFRFVRDKDCFTGAFRYGCVVYLGVIFNFLNFRIDQLMINYFQGPRGVGIYTVSVSWAEMLWLIDYAVINAALYNISSLSPGESWDLTWSLVKKTSLLLATGAVVLGVVSSPLVRFMYGLEFAGAVMPLLLLLPGVVAWGAGRILSQFISYNAGKAYVCTVAAFVGSVLNVIANLYTIPRWGLIGAAFTSTVSYVTTLGVLAVAFCALRRVSGRMDVARLPGL